jgi:2-keto-4-pentenoate hydratase
MDAEAKVAAGMRAQLGRRDAELVAGARPLGWKLGLTVPAVQERLGLDGPVVGFLTSGTELPDGAQALLAGFTSAMAEPEVAIHVGEGGAIAGLGPAIELVDIDLPFEDVEAILAGNVFHRAVVLGPPQAAGSLDAVTARVVRGAEPVAEAPAAPVVGDPAAVVSFVEEFLAPHGGEVKAGDVIIAGSLTAPVPVEPGQEIAVDLGPLGSLRLGFPSGD